MAGNLLPNMLQNFILELDGKAAGRLFGMTGGGVHADVIQAKGGPLSPGHKHIGGIKYEDMTLTCGTGMAQAFYDWIGDSFGGSSKRKSGAVVSLQANHKPLWRLEFNNALISSVEFPQCDAASKDAAHLTIVISPERTRSVTTDLSQNPGVYVSALPKGWYIHDFRLSIDGLENDCGHVRRIGPVRLGRKVRFDPTSDTKNEGPEEYSDLVVTLTSNHATGFYNWIQAFVEEGKNSPSDEKKGVLQFFAPNATKAYFRLELLGLGPYEMEWEKNVNPNIAMPVDFKLYCNKIRFSAGPSAVM